MRSSWKIGVLVLSIVVICGAAITWPVYRARTVELKLAHDARVYRLGAEQGNAEAQAALGYMYFHGRGVPQDYREALGWYRRAADQGLAKAENGIAFMYYSGKGVPQDYAEALRWYRKAADQGYESAQDSLGSMYYEGKGVSQNYPEALRWYSKAAKEGYPKAEYNLGNIYYYGRGVPQDRAEGGRLYCEAAAQGDEYALRAVGGDLTLLGKLFIIGQCLAGVWLSLDFLSSRSPIAGNSLRDFHQKVITGTGVLAVLSAGLTWYGYDHNKIRSVSCGLDGFTLFRWLLYATLIGLLVYLMRSGKKSAERRGGTESRENTARGSGDT